MSDGERGSVLPLVLGYVTVVVALLALVASTAQVVLARQALQAAADGAALAAAEAADPGRLATSGAVGALPLTRASVTTSVARYARDADLARRFPRLRWSARTDGATAAVRLVSEVRLPLAGWAGVPRVTVSADAAARSPVAP